MVVAHKLVGVEAPILNSEDPEEQNHMVWNSLRMKGDEAALRMTMEMVDCMVETGLRVEVGLKKTSLDEVEEHTGLLPFLNRDSQT